MAITTDAQALEALYGGRSGAAQPAPMQDLYAPGVRPDHQAGPPSRQGQIPMGIPVPEGQYINQTMGRGMAVVPPRKEETGQPAMAVIPPQESSRTTLGTFVETKPVVASRTNPLVQDDRVVVPAVPVILTEHEPKKKRELDLAKEILTHIWELGGEKSEEAQKFYERSHDTLRNWVRSPATIPLGAITKFLSRKPGIREILLEQLEPHFAWDGDGGTQSLPNRTKTSVVVCAPIMGKPSLPFLWTCLYLAKKYELGFDIQADTAIWRSRNMLAHRFLKSGATWSLWLDSDMAAPIANPDWYRWITNSTSIPQEYTSYDVLARLLSHKQAITGGVYAGRKYHGSLIMQPEINPRSHDDKLLCNEIRRGTARGLKEVDWIGFGCAMVHRDVFLEIHRTCGDEIRPRSEISPWRSFQPLGDEGEDEAFCVRAKRCGIPIWLDTQLVCPHIGSMAYLPEHTMAVGAI
jgi:hypothetical protein